MSLLGEFAVEYVELDRGAGVAGQVGQDLLDRHPRHWHAATAFLRDHGENVALLDSCRCQPTQSQSGGDLNGVAGPPQPGGIGERGRPLKEQRAGQREGRKSA